MAVCGIAIIGLTISTAKINSKNSELTSENARLGSQLQVTSKKLDAETAESTQLRNALGDADHKAADLDTKVSQLQFQLSQIRDKADSVMQTEQTVLAVVQQEANSRKSHFDGRNVNPAEYRHYYAEISAIDSSACPADFRDSWHDFVQSVEFKIQHPILSNGKNSSETPAAKRRDLEALAAKYGVVFKAP